MLQCVATQEMIKEQDVRTAYLRFRLPISDDIPKSYSSVAAGCLYNQRAVLLDPRGQSADDLTA